MIALATERVVEPVEKMHLAIARPWFEATGALGQPARALHEGVSRSVYSLIRLAARATATGIDAAGATAPVGATSFINGLWGDSLEHYEDFLATSMSLRRSDDRAPTGRLVVLVHGLMATERSFVGSEERPGLLRRLQQERELTPLTVRYNTGLAIDINGQLLADELEAVVSAWPVAVESIALVGHSMGGLVIEQARLAAQTSQQDWANSVSDVVTVAAPYRGAPLERIVSFVARTLRVAPQTEPLADLLDTRSRGIKDLRSGDLEWPQPAPGGRHHFVAGVVTADPSHPMAAIVGDLMVQPASSTGAGHVTPASVEMLGGVNHFDLLGDPAVVECVMGWLA